MRSILLLTILFGWAMSYSQGNGFSFTYTGPNQIIVGQDCVAELEWGHPNTPTVQSNIPGGMIVSFNIYSISGGYNIGDDVHGGVVVTVFYQAIDNYGNNALFGFTIAFIDLLPPVFDPLSLPPNLTVNCTGNFPIADVEVSDNCESDDLLLTLTFTENNNAVPCIGGIITRTWVADDDLGNLATFIQTITVLPDNTPPVITNNLQDGSAPCANAMAQYAAWLAAQRAAFSATDSGCGVMSLTDNAPPPAIITSFCGDVVVTFTAKDNCNNISTVNKTFTVFNNVPPVITNPATDSSGNCSQNNINQIFNNWINVHGGATATDDCSSIFWTTFPPSPSINDTCNTAIEVLFIAGDGCNNFDTTAASFVLTDNTPPVITTPPTTMILSCSNPAIDSLLLDWLMTHGHSAAHDLCTDDDDLIEGFRMFGNDLSLQEVQDVWLDSLASECHDNVIINGVGINNVKAFIEVQFIYDDNCNNETGVTGFFGITDNGRPIFLTEPSDTSFACAQGENWEDVFTGWYNSAGGSTYSDQCSEVDVLASITADSAIQYLAAALDTGCLQGVQVTIQFTLVDGCGNTSLNMPAASFILQDTVPPVLITPASDFNASCSLDGQEQLNNWLDTLAGAEASDGCGSLMWMFTWVDTSGMAIHGVPGTGPYPELQPLDCAGGIEIIFTASDVCQNTVSDTAIFSIIDTLPPDIFIPEDTIHLTCLDTIPLIIPEVTDSCSGEIMITFIDSLSADSCIGQPEVVVRIWTATDDCGNSATAQQVFLRLDTIPPIFELPVDTVSFCSVDTLMLLNVSDNCDPAPVSTFTDLITGPACQQMLVRTWIVTDVCGNSATAEQNFDLSDTSPPVITFSPGHYVYACDETNVQDAYEQWKDSVVVMDGCSDVDYFIARPGSYLVEDTSTWPGTPLPDSVFLSCADDLMIHGDLVAFDVCGNIIVEQISFSVNDTTGPVVNCPGVIVVEPDSANCNGLVHLVPPPFEEICYPDDVKLVFLINNGDTLSFDTTGVLDTIMPVGLHTVLWVATDCKGNVGTCLTSIEIIDENAISLTCPTDTLLFTSDATCTTSLWIHPPATTLGHCGLGVVELRLEIIGNAEPDSMIFESSSDSILVIFMTGIHQVLLIARDSTGDIDTCIFLVELRDTIDPVIICQTDTLYLHPSGVGDVDLSTTSLVDSTSDNCNIHSLVYDPPFVNCDGAGQTLSVTIVVFDESGNTSMCVSDLFVTVQQLIPLWERGLCDDTLRLFANIPPGPDVPYVYLWSGPNGFMSNEENPIIPGSDTTFSGTYHLVIQSDSGCIASGSVEVEIQTLVSPEIIIPDDTICTEEVIELTTQNYTGLVTYQWYQINPAGDTTISMTNEPSFIFSTGEPGLYSFFAVVIQDTCSSLPGPDVEIYVVPVPVVMILDVSPVYCIDDTLFLLPSIIEDSLSYHWTGPNGYESDEVTPSGIPVIEIDSPAIFILTVMSAHCTSAPDSVLVNIQQQVATPSISGDTITCEGGTFILVASTQADSYLWIDPVSNTTITDTNILIVVTADAGQSGDWHVVAFQNGCASDTSLAFNVQIDTAIVVQIVAPDRVCEGDSIQLSITPSTDGIYTWSGPGGFGSDMISPVLLAEEGIYTVFVQTTTGCEAMDSMLVSVDILPAILSLETDADSCADGIGDIRLWANVEPAISGYLYEWAGPLGFASQDSSPVIPDFNSSLNGEYTLFITNGACVTDTSILIIEVTDNPAPPVISGETVYCNGDTIILSVDPVDAATYIWSTPDTVIVIPFPGTLTIPDVDQSHTGNYSVIASLVGCHSTSSGIEILVKAPLATPAISTTALVCEGDSLILVSDAPPGATLQWFGPNGFVSNDITPVIFPALSDAAGLYTVVYIFEGCISDTSSPVDIKIQSSLEAPSILADVVSVCIDQQTSVMLCIDPATTTDGGMYTWYLNGSTILEGPGIDLCIDVDGSQLQGGANFITAISTLQGCISDTGIALLITGDEIPSQLSDAGIDMQYCPDELIVLDATDPSPATGTWTSNSALVFFDDIHNPATEIGPLPPGNYGLTWTLSFASCADYSTDSIEISISSSPVILPDTFEVPFGQTVEFIATTNDSLFGMPFTLQIVSKTQHGNALHAGNGKFRYTPNIGFVGTDMMTYRICLTDCPEECSEAIIILRVGNEDDCFTPTLFTPNEDGVNDVLIVPCLETSRFPENSIIVFNEWGDVVFKASPYQNDWDGRFSGDPLPVGTYFYIMDFGDGSKPERTFLILER